MLKKLFIGIFSLTVLTLVSLNFDLYAREKDGLTVNRSYTYAIGTHKANGSSGKCTSNGVTHVYNYPGIDYQYYDVTHLGNTAKASLRAKTPADTKYYTDSSVITF